MSRPQVVVFDYGFGNIRSAQRSCERVGAAVTVTSDLQDARRCDGLVIPGVGAFAACMDGLEASGVVPVLRERVASGAPVLGICVGAQVLFSRGIEHGLQRDGVGLLDGDVTRIDAPILPHMGWDTVVAPTGSTLYSGIDPDERFYFVHSYAAKAAPGALVAICDFGEPFVASAESGALSATQFHPEKSGDAGAQLLTNWMRSL